jgi:hypothetical protein
VSTAQLFPEVLDGSTLGAKFSQAVYLPIGIEGQADNAGSGSIGVVYTVARASEADTLFGPVSKLGVLVKFLLERGVSPIVATISQRGSTPLLAERQAAWALLESRRDVRIRLTGSTVQADLAALADSCENASLINNKQFCIVGMPTTTSKAALITAATAVNSTRGILVGPGIIDENGTLRDGSFAAAAVAAEVAKNADPADDLDTMELPGILGIEHDANGNDLFRIKVVSGAASNDFQDLLVAGVSPLQPGRNGGAAISHLRTTFTADGTYDALMTRIIVDQIFVLVREYAYDFNYLRKGNTPTNRALLRAGVEALLGNHSDWIQPKVQSDNTLGYKVTVEASADERQMIVRYEGKVVRGVQTILVDGNLSIAV